MTTTTDGVTHPPAISGEVALERARAMKDVIRAHAAEAEERGHYGDAVHTALLEHGFYHLLTPKRYGGSALSRQDWLRVVAEIAAADPGTGWCYCLTHSHNLFVASLWPESTQDRLFAARGAAYFGSSHSLALAGTAKKVDGGYLLNGLSRYQSGSPRATHAVVHLAIEGEEVAPGVPRTVQALVALDEAELLDDWADRRVLGMRGSGSNSVSLHNVFVPEDQVVDLAWIGSLDPVETGAAVHDDPVFLGAAQSFLIAELGAILVGTGRAALEEWERLAHERRVFLPPFGLLAEDPQMQREYAEARAKINAAEAVVWHIGGLLDRSAEKHFREGAPFPRSLDTECYALALEAGRLATDAVAILFRSAGSSEARAGRPMERYLRDSLMYQTHAGAQYGSWMQVIGASQLGAGGAGFLE